MSLSRWPVTGLSSAGIRVTAEIYRLYPVYTMKLARRAGAS